MAKGREESLDLDFVFGFGRGVNGLNHTHQHWILPSSNENCRNLHYSFYLKFISPWTKNKSQDMKQSQRTPVKEPLPVFLFYRKNFIKEWNIIWKPAEVKQGQRNFLHWHLSS